MGESILYVDPSFKGTGLFLVDSSTKTFTFGLIQAKEGTMRSYENYATTGLRVVDGFLTFLEAHQPSIVKLEVPPPRGQTSAGLMGLSFLLIDRAARLPCVERIELINPTFVSLAQRKLYSDTASRSRIAKEFSQRQKKWVLGSVWVNEELLDDNDVSTAYLFYVFEKIHEGSPFRTFPTKPSKPLTTTTTNTPTHHTTTTTTTITTKANSTTAIAPSREKGRSTKQKLRSPQ